MNQAVRIPCTIMRGGTSKGLIIKSIHLPKHKVARDKVITRIFGSPDIRQIDGLGGGTALTSKVAIVGPTSHPGADVSYNFGQVSLEDETIDYKPTCGNMAAAVGLFAAEEGYVELTEPITRVRIYNENTKKIIEAEIPVKNGDIVYDGDFSIDGVPGTGPCIMINFLESGGAITGKLLPTGNVRDVVTLDDGRQFEVSVVDSANVNVFVQADQLGVKGIELGDEFNQNASLLSTLEAIRVKIGVHIGLIDDPTVVTPVSHALPKISVVSKPQSYVTSSGRTISEQDIHIVGRYVAMGRLHQAFAVSGGIAVATAARIPGTIIHNITSLTNPGGLLTIGHPSGVIAVDAQVEMNENEFQVKRASIGRTARRLMDGFAYFPLVNGKSMGLVQPSIMQIQNEECLRS
jgi:2-methylaconitate cis-trans-isomerase PrpF